MRVLAGSFEGVASPLTALLTPVTFLDVHLDPEAIFELEVPPQQTAFAFGIAGAGEVGGAAFGAHGVVGFSTEGDRIAITGRGGRPFELLVGLGSPIREPVVARGPFVMTNLDAIRAAEARFRSGGMGRLAPSF